MSGYVHGVRRVHVTTRTSGAFDAIRTSEGNSHTRWPGRRSEVAPLRHKSVRVDSAALQAVPPPLVAGLFARPSPVDFRCLLGMLLKSDSTYRFAAVAFG